MSIFCSLAFQKAQIKFITTSKQTEMMEREGSDPNIERFSLQTENYKKNNISLWVLC